MGLLDSLLQETLKILSALRRHVQHSPPLVKTSSQLCEHSVAAASQCQKFWHFPSFNIHHYPSSFGQLESDNTVYNITKAKSQFCPNILCAICWDQTCCNT